MTTLSDRPNTALVVIDVQNGVVGGAHDRDAVVANISSLVDKARGEGVPVVWVQHSDDEHLVQGSDAWQYVPELTQQETEPVVHKTFGDSFEGTDLEDVLARAGIGHLVVAGAQTDQCIRNTHPRCLHAGLRRDAGRRRAHDRGPERVGCAAAGQGHRAHEPVLGGAGGTRPDRGRDQGGGRVLQRSRSR